MLKLLSASSELRLGIAPDGLALLKTADRRAQASVLAEHRAAPDQLAAPQAVAGALRAMLKDAPCKGLAATIVLADQWVRLFMVTPPKNTESLKDCQAAAAMRFSDLYGESLAGWELRADWDAQQPFLACAVPQAMLAMLAQVAAECRWTLLAIVPQFVAAWNRWHKQLDGSAWFGVALGDRLTLGAIDGGALRAVNVSQVGDGAWQDEQWLPAHLARQALRLNLPPPAQLRICGCIAGLPASRIEIAPGCRRIDAGPAAPGAAASAALTLARTGMAA